MEIPIHHVDAFVTDGVFTGNPAAVCPLDAWLPDAVMQKVAAENNLAETAFLVGAKGDYSIRWMTPAVEVDLCGHATLAAAHLLGGAGAFHTRSGRLVCAPGGEGWIDMTLPLDAPVAEDPPALSASAGWRWFGRGRFDVLIELDNASQVRDYVPDLRALATLRSRAVIITAPGDREGIDFVSRVFGPNAGIDEDPVTGSAHSTLAVFWGVRLDRDQLVGEQASPRGGVVRVRLAPDHVVVSGQAVTVSEVTLLV